MKNKLVMALIVAVAVLSGCSKEAAVSTEEQVDFETINQSGQQTSEADSETVEESVTTEDYTDQIKTEIDEIKSDSLSDELVKANELYNKYDELRMNAQDQTSINSLSQWGTLVWKDETLSLLDRIKEKDSGNYDAILAQYESWEKYVPSMAEKMSETYKDGSIYPTIYSYNEAMRYKQKAYSLASALADLAGEVEFSFPDSTLCGYYGDYSGDSYLIVTEGMESDSYEVTIRIDASKQLNGYATPYEYPGDKKVLLFTSNDDTVKGTIDGFDLDATFYVSETDGSVVESEMAYSFSSKY